MAAANQNKKHEPTQLQAQVKNVMDANCHVSMLLQIAADLAKGTSDELYTLICSARRFVNDEFAFAQEQESLADSEAKKGGA